MHTQGICVLGRQHHFAHNSRTFQTDGKGEEKMYMGLEELESLRQLGPKLEEAVAGVSQDEASVLLQR